MWFLKRSYSPNHKMWYCFSFFICCCRLLLAALRLYEQVVISSEFAAFGQCDTLSERSTWCDWDMTQRACLRWTRFSLFKTNKFSSADRLDCLIVSTELITRSIGCFASCKMPSSVKYKLHRRWSISRDEHTILHNYVSFSGLPHRSAAVCRHNERCRRCPLHLNRYVKA